MLDHLNSQRNAVNTYIALGSNMADPLTQVCQAIEEIAKLKKSRLLACSKIYKSLPMRTDAHIEKNIQQADYINAVVLIDTLFSPLVLLDELQHIENKHSRVRSEQRWDPRTLDLDILLYGDQVINEDRLIIPHVGISGRDFVLVPLSDINPDLFIPGQGLVSNLVKECRSYQLREIKPISLLS